MNTIQYSITEGDSTGRIRAILQTHAEDLTLEFEPGEYHFWPDEAFEKYCFVSNNQHGLKRIAFPLIGKTNFAIRGHGARLVFHGEIIPFLVEHSNQIRLEGITIDWRRPFYSQGVVTAVDEAGVNVRIDAERYPYRVDRGRITFEGEGWESGLTEGVFAYDPTTRAPAYLSGDSMGLGFPDAIAVEPNVDGSIRLAEHFPAPPAPGYIIVFRHYKRCCPGIILSRCNDVALNDITLHHAGAMGVIAQFCEDITLRRCAVTPSDDRLFSVAADATHFVNCRGKLLLDDCLFENQLDDPVNVHGINTRIKKILTHRSVIVELVHPEQHGVEVGLPGDRMTFADNTTLLTYAENTLAAVEPLNARYVKVTLVDDLPEALQPNHVMDNASWTADLHIRQCTVRNNRARGFLISTPGKVLVERCQIAAPGSAIKISGDANYWFESGAVRSVIIRDNHFGDCCYGAEPWGRSVIVIDPEIEDAYLGETCFHRDIRIEHNIFATFNTSLLFARSVDRLTFADNAHTRTNTYAPFDHQTPPVQFCGCQTVDIRNNTLDGEPLEFAFEAEPDSGLLLQ